MNSVKRWTRIAGITLLIGALIVSSPSSLFFGEESETPVTEESQGTQQSKQENLSEEAVAVVSEMSKVAENQKLALYANPQSGEFYVEDKTDGRKWFSNPPDRENDEYASQDRTAVHSQLLVKVVDTTTQQEQTINNYVRSVQKNTVDYEKTDDGFKIVYRFENEKFSIPMVVALKEDYVSVTIPVEEITEESVSQILQITVLPYFFAGGIQGTGYMVVPDGSGAVINFNNNKQGYVQYQEPIYGSDVVLTGNSAVRKKENSCLPLFGIVSGDQAVAGIISEGDGAALVSAKVSQKGSGYNNACTIFNLRSSGTHTIGDYYGKEIKTYEKGQSKLKNCTVQYHFLKGEDADYTGIAKAYRSYLEEQLSLQAVKSEDFSIFVELVGGVKKTKSFLGFPIKSVEPLTTFDEAQTIVNALKELGVDNIIVDYQNWDKDTIMDKVTAKPSFAGNMGGKSDYKKLAEFLAENNIPLVNNVNMNTFLQSGNGISKQFDAAKLFTGIPGIKYGFKINTQEMDNSIDQTFYTAPRELAGLFEKFLSGSEKLGMQNIGLDTMGTILYSDFSKNGMNRDAVKQEFQRLMAMAVEEGRQLYVRTGNGYTLPYASYIYDMPSESSKNDMTDYSIPLYQLAMSGFRPYALTDINHDANPVEQLLKCMEYGSDLKFTWYYQSGDKVSDTTLANLYAGYYQPWLEFVETYYDKAKTVKAQVSGAEMIGHYQLAADVYQTVYSNGKSIIVNYGEEAFQAGATAVAAMDYELIDGGDRIE